MARSKKVQAEVSKVEIPVPAGPVQKVPQGSTWALRGWKSDVLLHEGISNKNAQHLLRGRTRRELLSLKVGEETCITLDGVDFVLQRTA